MAPFPLALADIFGHWGSYIIYLFIGISFGAVLELSGFGFSPKLAAQFYFKDMTVFKVMFTAIIVAMLLVFFTSAIGLLDYNLVWVNPTYLWPGIVGGLLMGVGFIVGGFCPGTSLVSAATLKLDGIFFVLGAFFGIFLFGETVENFESFWNSSHMGRFTLPELFGVSTGAIVLFIVVAAVMAFWGAEKVEQHLNSEDKAIHNPPKWRYSAAAAVVLLGLLVVIVGQPTTEDKWNNIAEEKEAELTERSVQIHPGELLETMHDDKLITYMIDVRNEVDYNLFHLLDAKNIQASKIPDMIDEFHEQPSNTVFVVMSNDELAATEVWKVLVAENVPNAYILEGGINGWLDTFSTEEFVTENKVDIKGEDMLTYKFTSALGDRLPTADPDPHSFELEYETKIELQAARGPSGGGCG